jgi:predicted dehydrogenase
MPAIGVGIVGSGFGQLVHLPAFRLDERCEVRALCGANLERTQRLAIELGIPQSCGNWRDLVADPSIDVVSIAVPPLIQAQIVAAALGQGKAVFCEKPPAVTFEQAAALAQTAQCLGMPNVVDFEFPEHTAWRIAKRNLAAGDIGDLRHIHVMWQVLTKANRLRLDDWKSDPAAGGGALLNFASHVFDYLERFAGPIVSLQARLRRAADDPRTAETAVDLWMELASGAVATVTVDCDAGPASLHRVQFFGETGTIEVVNEANDYLQGFRCLMGPRSGERVLRRVDEDDVPADDVALKDAAIDGRIPAVARLVRQLIDWRLGGPPARPSLAEGARVMQLVDAARESSKASGRPVEVRQAVADAASVGIAAASGREP